jgi:succinyl-CoA synthetase alpha subunit
MEAGRIGIVSRSPAFEDEVLRQLSAYGLGASKVVHLPAQGVTHLALLKMFEDHWGTDAVLLLGAIDAGEEGACIEWISRHMDKPVFGFIGEADADPGQADRLRAAGVHMGGDAATVGELIASLVESPWLPFD